GTRRRRRPSGRPRDADGPRLGPRVTIAGLPATGARARPVPWVHRSVMSTRVAICSMAAPWEQNVTIGMFNVHQANAMRGLGVTAEVFAPAMIYPGWLEPFSERAARANTRPDEYTYQGVRFHSARA